MSYSLTVTESGGLTLGLTGPAGPTGPAGGVTSVAGRTGAITLVSADITNATSSATPNTVVKRDADGGVYFGRTSSGDFGVRAYTGNGSALAGVASGYGSAFSGTSADGVAMFGSSSNSHGLVTFTVNGTYHAVFGSAGSDRSFIARVNGAFGWLRNSERTLTIEAAATLDASRTYIIPDATGTTVPIVPAYADITAANAALPADEFYWDTTDKKLRVTTA